MIYNKDGLFYYESYQNEYCKLNLLLYITFLFVNPAGCKTWTLLSLLGQHFLMSIFGYPIWFILFSESF